MKGHDDIQFMAWQWEQAGKTGKPHIQLYVELKDKKHKASAQKIQTVLKSPGCHVELRKGTQEQAIAYCSKEDTRATYEKVKAWYDCVLDGAERYAFIIPEMMGPKQWGKPHAVSGAQGKRTDLDECYKMVKEGLTFRELLDRQPGTVIKHYSAFSKLTTVMDTRPVVKPTVIVITGDSGCGKSVTAARLAGDRRFVYTCNSSGNEWWDGYSSESHDAIIFDDFGKGQMALSSVLRICDALDYRCQIKGGTELLKAKVIIFTSNNTVEEWYDKIEEERKVALYRRIDILIKMKRGEIYGDIVEQYVGNYDVLTALGKGPEAEKILCMQKVSSSSFFIGEGKCRSCVTSPRISARSTRGKKANAFLPYVGPLVRVWGYRD